MTVEGIKDLESKLGDYAKNFDYELITVPQKGKFVKFQNREGVWLKGDTFSAVSSIVKEFGGEWVSTGKNSHFRVPIENQISIDPSTLCSLCGNPIAESDRHRWGIGVFDLGNMQTTEFKWLCKKCGENMKR